MKVIVDMDEVLAQFVQKVLDRWNAENGTSFTHDQIDMWHMEETLGPKSWGKIDGWCGEKGFFRSLDPVPGAVAGFRSLMEAGHDVIVATAVVKTADNCYDDKRAWMRDHFPDWSLKNLIAVSRKGMLRGDILIDDGEHNIKDWTEEGPVNGAILFDAPWNRDVPSVVNRKYVRRAHGWDEIPKIVEGIEYIRSNRIIIDD